MSGSLLVNLRREDSDDNIPFKGGGNTLAWDDADANLQ